MTLKELIANKAFADNVVITVNNQPFQLGELRGLSAETQNALSKRETELAARATQLDAGLEELKKAQRTVGDMFLQTQQEQERLAALAKTVSAAPTAGVVDPFEALFQDNVLGPAMKAVKSELRATKDALAAQEARSKQIADSLQKTAEAYLSDRYTDQYESLVPVAKQKDLPLEQLIKFASDNGFKTRSGYPDIKRAYKEVTAPDAAAEREAALRTQIEQELTEKFAAQGIRVGSPSGGVPGPGVPLNGSNREPSQFKDLDAAFAAANKDPLFQRDVSTLPIQ